MARITIEVSEKGIKEAERALANLGKEGDKTQSSMSSIAGGVKAAGAAIAVATTTIVAFSSAMASNSIQLQKNAANAKLTVTEFQNMASAAGTVGLDVDQVGSILADAQEKIGDFLATGGGGFMDFVDVMGLTEDQAISLAKEFEEMSGRDVLISMTSQMQAAGVSAQRMGFALEGMASDSRDLIPLLIDNGESLKNLEGRFDTISTTISDDTVKSMSELSAVSVVVAKNLGNTLATALSGVSDYLVRAGEGMAFFLASTQEGTSQQLLSDMVKLDEQIKTIESTLSSGEISGGLFTTTEELVSDTESALERLKNEYKELDKQYQDLYGVGAKTREELDAPKAVKLIDDEISSTPSAYEIKKEDEAKRIEEITQNSIDKQVEALQAQYESEKSILDKKLSLIDQSTLKEGEQLTLRKQLQHEYYQAVDQMAQDSADYQSQIEAKEQADRESRNKQASSAWGDMTDDLKSTLGEQDGLYKASATTNATIKTYEAANGAYAALAPIPYVGPALGATAAGVAIASGLKNVAYINSARMQGGSVTANTPYAIGERGPETFVPDSNGKIVPNHQLSGTQQMIVKIFNYTSDNVTAQQNSNGELEVYVRKDELDDLMSGNLANVNSSSGSALNSTYNMQR